MEINTYFLEDKLKNKNLNYQTKSLIIQVFYSYFIYFVIKFREFTNYKIGDKMQKFKDYVNILNRKITVNKKEILFVCIGTNEVIWDSVGPRVGSYLKKRIGETKVLGDINNNICSKRDLIYHYSKIKNKFIIAIDTAIANKELEGEIFINDSPIIMGLGIEKNKGSIGNISIKAGISNLKMIDKKYVNNMARIVGEGICYWYNN